MEGNRDESGRCILIARKSIANGDNEKAVRFLLKAEKLYPTQEAKDLLSELQNNKNSSSKSSSNDTKDSEGVRKRKGSFGRESKESNKENKPIDYTPEQVEQVTRIHKCKDFYDILCVSKDASEVELKKAYRKLALQMHPDKNKAPGATESFKAVGTAFSVLSDSTKRKRYDTYGPEMEAPSRRTQRDYDYSHGFEGDISPEELFNMFFGGGFPSNGTTRYHQRRNNQTYGTHHFTRESQSESGYTLFLQLTPILLLVLLSLLSSMFVSDPIFNLQRTSKYSVERKTYNLKIPYYVKDDFRPEFKGELRRIDRQVEEEYASNLRANCWRERSYKESMLWKARNYGDAKLYQRAQDLGTPSCDQLHRMYS